MRSLSRYNHVTFWVFVVATITLSIFANFFPALAEGCSTAIPLEVPIGGQTISRGLTNHVSSLYEFGISIIGILAVVKIMVGGISWVTAGGKAESISEAKGHIYNALIGLGIALFSFIILNALNPALTQVSEICPTGINVRTKTGDFGTQSWTECPSGNNSECVGVSYCNEGCLCQTLPNSKSACVTTSVNLLTRGNACASDSNCVEPLTCENVGRNSPGACGESGEGSSCKPDGTCDNGLTCVTTSPNNTSCLPAAGRGLGEFCEKDSECDGVCRAGQCATGTTGSGCSTSGDSACLPAFKCDTGTCQPRVSGDDCEDGLNATCGSGLFCVRDSNLFSGSYACSDRSVGAPCMEGSACASGYCNGIENECTSGATGVECIANEGCEDFCVYYQTDSGNSPGTCRSGQNGSFCDGPTNADCNSGLECQGGICLVP